MGGSACLHGGACFPNSRLRQFDYQTDLVLSDECSELVHEKDKDEFEKHQQSAQQAQQDKHDFMSEWVAEKKKTSQYQKLQNKKSPTSKNALGKNLPKTFEVHGNITRAEAMACVPEGTKIYRDDMNGRWQATYSKGGRRISSSFAFMLYGFEGACQLAVRWCWSEWLGMQGLAAQSCPVQGVFGGRDAPCNEDASKQDCRSSSSNVA